MPTDAQGLFERHHLAIYRYLRHLLGRPDLAEDLTQEVFLRALSRLDDYEERGQERPWLFRIARNLALDHNRRVRAAARVDSDAQAVQSASQLLRLSLEGALAELPRDDRDMFLLRELGGLGYAEIATVCGVSSDAVRSRIYRARRKLRESVRGLEQGATLGARTRRFHE